MTAPPFRIVLVCPTVRSVRLIEKRKSNKKKAKQKKRKKKKNEAQRIKPQDAFYTILEKWKRQTAPFLCAK